MTDTPTERLVDDWLAAERVKAAWESFQEASATASKRGIHIQLRSPTTLKRPAHAAPPTNTAHIRLYMHREFT